MIHRPYHKEFPVFPMKGELSEVNTGDSILYIKKCMDGSIQAKYGKKLLDLLDRVFTQDGMKFLSIEQERFMSEFFKQAGAVNDNIDSSKANPFNDMDEVFRQLDSYMGSYRGVNDEQYS